ncbi:hypothetical protein [Hymenobacter psychrotolerans]|uniref:Uncharacterized protein n=1 Tax=Hymenobacter psychrotolerans DSM 18569 TaxID=1121959 RepID=A0A1M6QH95_9BACT|nr:hypothetical protein [Hymenobacter psychrotolerans]SHK19407.1 hypothetical protein SAMN02746009_00556 [Hymenobacter psychrotolerans DSM 18569]
MAIDPNDRPVRVINDDTTEQEMAAGHITPGGDPPKNEAARGGFGNREGKEGYGTDSGNGISAVSVNEDADKAGHPADNIRAADETRPDRPNQDMPDENDADLEAHRPVDELDRDDARPGRDEMSDPDSRVGMGQMDRPTGTNADLARQGTNADLTDPNATDTDIDQ